MLSVVIVVMQPLDVVSGLLECLYQAMQTQEKQFSIAVIKQLSREKRKTLCLGY